ncbi:MAG: glycosyltransferase family 2 protein [Deltaproteobacteria bacterium]|nr:glycosyltransferase family 2 protein [Deltaproteobacteria bacterium]
MPPPGKISTVILFWNKPSLTSRCVRSIPSAASKILLVDNGGTLANRAKIEQELNENGVMFEIITLPVNVGFARGMNAGLRAAFSGGAAVAAALSNDVEVAPDFFEALARLDVNRAAIYCPTVHHLLDRAKVAYTHGNVDVERMELSHSTEDIGERIVFPRYYPAAVTVWTKGAFEKLGGFNEEFFCYWEDVELSYRAKKADVSLVSLANARVPGVPCAPCVYHLGRGTTGGKPAMTASFFEGRERFRKILNEGTL